VTTVLALSLVVAFVPAVAAQAPGADSLRLLALRIPESALVLEIRSRPLAVRDAVTQALARGDESAARSLAAAYATAWSDSFLVREVARFTAWPPERRAAKVWADSVRRSGVAAFGQGGPRAGMALWRRALERALAIADTAGAAAVLGNLGAGFLREGRLDSAVVYLERSRLLAAAVGDIRVEANAIGTLAGARADQGDLDAARAGYARALALRDRIGDTRGVAADHNNLGLLAQTAGDGEEARRQFEAALALNRRDGRDEVAATNLVNLAGLAAETGDFTRAEALYRDGLATWRSREQWPDAADALRGLGQLELRRGDYPAAQAALREALGLYERTGPLVDALAVRRDLAGALAAAGELQAALDQLRRAQRLADSARAPPGVRAGITLARADLAAQLNTLAEGDRLYTQAERLFRQASDPRGEAEARQGRGQLLLAREDYARASLLLEGALRTELATGNERAAALTRLSLGQVAHARGDTATAVRLFAQATVDLDRLGDPVGAAAALGERAAAAAAAKLSITAESLYRAGLDRLGDRVAPEIAWRLHAGLGLTLHAQAHDDDAARELRAALAEIERPSRSLALPERRSAFLTDKWDVYAQLALLERARGLPGAAFESSERLHARQMLELLGRGRVTSSGDTAADLVAREQDLRRRMAERTQELAQAEDEALRGPAPAQTATAAREALARDQEAYAELLLEMRERSPRHAALIAPKTAEWRDVARRLAPDAAFIEYLVGDSASLAFVITRDTVVALDLGLRRHDLARLVEFTRGTLVIPPLRVAERGTGGEDLWRGPLRQLHQYLIAPIEETHLLAGKTRLTLVPHGELHYLPFAALLEPSGPGAGRFLIERYDLAVTPSGAIWLALGDRSARHAAGGVLALAPRTDLLPASRREVAAVARLGGPEVETLMGNAASEDAFRRMAPTRRVLHFATYGVLNKRNPLFSFVDLAPGGGQDGRLEVHEVLGLHLAADLVVLSACQTGLGSGALADIPAGDDWVGLTRAFLHAGAANVVATLWPVEDWATAALMERFYEGYQSQGDPVPALARAQRALLATRPVAHPFYWAGFVSAGGAGAGAAAP
jgi:CHAT domain-containing protein/tetratricopeptide (TPR) repeat protein